MAFSLFLSLPHTVTHTTSLVSKIYVTTPGFLILGFVLIALRRSAWQNSRAIEFTTQT